MTVSEMDSQRTKGSVLKGSGVSCCFGFLFVEVFLICVFFLFVCFARVCICFDSGFFVVLFVCFVFLNVKKLKWKTLKIPLGQPKLRIYFKH